MEVPISSNPNPNPNFLNNNNGGYLPSPPLDDAILTGDLFSGDCDDFNLGVDFDFSLDDLDFADEFLLESPVVVEPESDVSQDRNSSPNNVVRVYDCSSPEVNNNNNHHGHEHEHVSSDESKVNLSCNSPEIGSCKSNSGVSHDSGNHSIDRDVYSSSFVNHIDNVNNHSGDSDNNLSESGGLGRKIKGEKIIGSYNDNKVMSKRKKEHEHEDGESSGDGEGRTSKFRRSSISTTVTESVGFDVGNDDDEKRKARLMRNRESAQLSRQRKKQYVEELEDKVRAMHSTITDLNSKISYMMAENATLRQQLSGGGGVCAPHPPPGMYPMAPMPYPWMPCPPYMVKPQGSHVPLVPIPRLKPQQPAPAPKVGKKSESRKSEGKTKKVASVSLLGLLFFFVLFGGLVPMVNVRYGGIRDGFRDLKKGTVLMVDNHVNRMGYKGGIGISDGKFHHGRVLQQSNTSDGGGFDPMRNSSEPLVASLYVPRNDKLVKIDGNLIIHSVLASEKASASNKDSRVKTSEETSLAISGSYPPYPVPGPGRSNGRHPHLDGNSNGRQRALGSGYTADTTPAGSDGKLQQWFREGLAEPMLSSGMCTEVFQFDISPAPGSIVPATSIANASEHRQNSTRVNKTKNRRILHGHPIPLDSLTLNATEEHVQPHEQNDGLQSNRSRSSMVVSVLVDPREAGDGDGEGVIRSKTLSRIFVVVLIDSVKYVTYSCMLPFMGSGSHLVTT